MIYLYKSLFQINMTTLHNDFDFEDNWYIITYDEDLALKTDVVFSPLATALFKAL
jgi:hypothetical protein